MTTVAEEDEGDEGDVELSSIQAIFPELIVDPSDSRKARLDLEVAPAAPLTVTFEPSINLDRLQLNGSHTAPENGHYDALQADAFPRRRVVRLLSHLPSLRLDIELPKGYPDDRAPIFSLSTEPAWLPQDTLGRLQEHGEAVWEESGRTECVYSYIDYVQTEMETAFGLASKGLELDEFHELPLVAYDKKILKAKFDEKTYDCGVCLYPKRGAACYQLKRCGHVFCKECLHDFYNNAIEEGEVDSVKCLDPDCGKTTERGKKPLHPVELLDIPLERDKVQRYVDLKLKKMLESDKTTIYCPRKWCLAPARAAKYAPYNTNDLEHWPDDDSADGTMENAVSKDGANEKFARGDRLAVCSKCQYAFCRICNKGWHGDFVNCLPPREDEQMSAEDKASYDFIRTHTSPCPYCNTPSQKMHGCNHMRCRQCNTHFCYLCSSWLSPNNPYKHFNTYGTPCYNLLWALEEGDTGQGRRAIFGGVRGVEQDVLLGDAQLAAAVGEEAEHEGGQGDADVAEGNDEDGVNRAALQRFVAMAANDEEDGWDSDELEDWDEGVFR